MTTQPDHEIVVIGAGPGGIAAGALLKRAGIDEFTILERAGEVGGSWRDNTYPGISVDVPALVYQYSFARKADWPTAFPTGAEVQAYHQDVARRYGLYRHLRFHVEIVREVWDEKHRRWALHTADGEIITARFVISAVGAFLRPKVDGGIQGLGDFANMVQRPDAWDHAHDLAGKRVAVVGTGASSVQITPAIAPEVGHLDVYQRTPVWCLPKPNYQVPRWLQAALRVPGVAAAQCGVILLGLEPIATLATYMPLAVAKPLMAAFDAFATRVYRAYLRRIVDDPETAAALTPGYGPMAKRLTLSTGFPAVFNRDNVRLITDDIERFTEQGIRTIDGTEYHYDVIVLATGYEMHTDPESYAEGAVVGRDGFDLGQFFGANGVQAYEGVAVAGLPNRWMLVGPYSLSDIGWHGMVETTASHAIRAIVEARRRRASTVEVSERAHAAYHAEIRKRGQVLRHYVETQNKGTRTYYRNSHGDTPYFRPAGALETRWRGRHFPFTDYHFEAEHQSGDREGNQEEGQARSALG
ncbi:NAD(P)/FAD-dependent oxidoreductase [Nocardia cyriacigeorgica]|uniref:NAD(P)/FAD-dependent oxidoreductase n=1 Tax=Nocardia cyriacigeorgica TaxID=135487 RepID=A0A6P1DAJ1_9NOCA|nr:NAD(P)/FAD-dependent oxidoreductase [Nocardia cyriacigeorgica]NEW41555.1 NAD(P)/FAD-dependent oxidoreductase [Nocardia cyriacigeorgica]NEW47745.1 NAD(P)/FAD-dependent oxidoreductase [Nocardia cyriacigeorgica]NEW56356.1 NAD(P)/FAD-dependent oxidoreductase [Nocardia cyriacigeorgica]